MLIFKETRLHHSITEHLYRNFSPPEYHRTSDLCPLRKSLQTPVSTTTLKNISIETCLHHNIFTETCLHNNIFAETCLHPNVFTQTCLHPNIRCQTVNVKTILIIITNLVLLFKFTQKNVKLS